MAMKCLVVDDSMVVRRAVRRIMDEVGFVCGEAGDGQQALDWIAANGYPDLIMLDWNMPVMNGIEFLKRLRVQPDGKKPKVIFCTTENEMERIVEALNTGADEYVMKPFDKDIIWDRCHHVGLLPERGGDSD